MTETGKNERALLSIKNTQKRPFVIRDDKKISIFAGR